MGLRPVQLTESGSGDRKRVRHVIGVDESGNPHPDSSPFVMAAVQCPRSSAERLAERLIESGLRPWRAKSRSLYGLLSDSAEQSSRVGEFLASIEGEEIHWSAAVGWDEYSIPERAAITTMIGSRTVTTPNSDREIDIEGDAVLLPDGDEDTFGGNQRDLRRQSAARFNDSFQSSYCSVFVSSLPQADYTYPEAIAADYIAGYIRDKLSQGDANVETLPPQVDRIDTNWRQPDLAPLPLYTLRTSGAMNPEQTLARVIAWIEGRCPPRNPAFSTGDQYRNFVRRIDSEVVRRYLYELRE